MILEYELAICNGYATELGIGLIENFPYLGTGNAFSIRTEIVPYENNLRACPDKYNDMPAACYQIYDITIEDYYVSNMCLENWRELFKRNILSWPVKFGIDENNNVFIIDDRIPKDWFGKNVYSK